MTIKGDSLDYFLSDIPITSHKMSTVGLLNDTLSIRCQDFSPPFDKNMI